MNNCSPSDPAAGRWPGPRIAALALLGLLAAGSTGCYTVLQHPPVQENLRLHSPDQGRNCLACHDQPGFDANVWSLAPRSPEARLGSYQYFGSYPWWWAEPAAISRSLQDSSLAATQPPVQAERGLAGVFNRLRTTIRDTSADSSGSSTVAPATPEKEKKESSPEFKRRRR